MSREIKFRVFHIPTETVLYQLTQSPCFGKYESDNFVSIEDVFFYEPQDFEVMQYTGLKDKNGVEIYEGDITRSILKPEGEEFTDLVKFENGRFVLSGPYNHLLNLWIGDEEITEIEVIGNIHSNPELLGHG